ncbi:MAG: hypothetical protein IPI04_05465 [Ignavibacteria bacterium]|nr:hypothetical protein [Ignavibacteria bacterium]MBK8381202.1 hypothetical protein [Ignavibacteria bacterium]
MKETIKKIKKTFIAGVILFLPVFVLLSIFQKVYGFIFGFGKKLTDLLGLSNVPGWDFAPALTTVLLIVIFYLFGLLTKISAVTKSKEWFENNVLSYVPNYSKFNAKMTIKLQPGEDLRQPALIEINDFRRPGFLIHSEEGKSTVFMPSTPDTDYGEVWVVDTKKVKQINMNAKEFKKSILLSGKGLKIN